MYRDAHPNGFERRACRAGGVERSVSLVVAIRLLNSEENDIFQYPSVPARAPCNVVTARADFRNSETLVIRVRQTSRFLKKKKFRATAVEPFTKISKSIRSVCSLRKRVTLRSSTWIRKRLWTRAEQTYFCRTRDSDEFPKFLHMRSFYCYESQRTSWSGTLRAGRRFWNSKLKILRNADPRWKLDPGETRVGS